MSHVDNVLLSFSIMEDQERRFSEVDTYLAGLKWGQFGPDLNDVHDRELGHAVGGYKSLETPLYVAAFNYADIDGLLHFMATLPWRHPESVQLIVKDQESDVFVIHHLPAVTP
jgi:hypothetical protein